MRNLHNLPFNLQLLSEENFQWCCEAVQAVFAAMWFVATPCCVPCLLAFPLPRNSRAGQLQQELRARIMQQLPEAKGWKPFYQLFESQTFYIKHQVLMEYWCTVYLESTCLRVKLLNYYHESGMTYLRASWVWQASYKIYGWLSGNLALFVWQPPRPDLALASTTDAKTTL